MNAMPGTDLFSAYSEPESMNVSNLDYASRPVSNIEYSPEVETFQTGPAPQVQEMPQKSAPSPPRPEGTTMVYDQSELLQNINESKLKEQMNVLKQEIDQQKKAQQVQYKESYEKKSFIDSFFRKKKEMIRFVSVSLIIMFALALHQILSELLGEYIDTKDMSRNKELITKFLYPISILATAWILKTINAQA